MSKVDTGNPVIRVSHRLVDLGRLFLNSHYTTEGQGASMIVALGIWFMLGYQFTSPAYAVMASVASEITWGVLFLFIGFAQFYALFFGSVEFRRYMLLLKGALWTTLAISVSYGDWHALSLPIYVVFAVSAFRAFLIYGRTKPVIDY